MSAQQATGTRKSETAARPTVRVTSWGRFPKTTHRLVHKPAWNDQIPAILETASPASLLPYGMGRSYGDSCLNAHRELIDCRRVNRILGFDESTGLVRCEAGVTLSDIISVFLPKGWFLPVTPGTQFVTIGGAIANDVHGKNHHCTGTFGNHIRQMGIHRSNDGLIVCSPQQESRLFRATVGGLGLTGVVAWADVQLRKVEGPWIDAETLPFESLDSFRSLSRDSDGKFEYTVAWLDSFSGKKTRGIFFRGNHSSESRVEFRPRRGPKLPFALPGFALNTLAIKAFNTAYYYAHAGNSGVSLVGYEPFFYPLDSVRQWNLVYGKRGFLQYQCVIPDESSGAIAELLDRIARSGMGSFLAVLKQFGSAPPVGMLSFPRPGLTLALDFAMRGERTLELMNSLDEVVLASGGALYPAKDARMSAAMFEASFPHWRQFVPFIDQKLSSSFWRRVTEGQ